MRLLLDTHALLWWLAGDLRLPEPSRRRIYESDAVHVSAVSAYEIAQKVRIGKLPSAGEVAQNFGAIMKDQGFIELPLTWETARYGGLADHPHRDPFDRMLVAQARLNQLAIVSNETLFDAFGIERVW